MDISNQNQTLYAKFIEEVVRGGQNYYHPSHMATSYWGRHPMHIERATQPRRYYFLCLKFAGLPALRVKLPRWATVHTIHT